MMNCLEYGEIIAAHVDGALSPEERMVVQSHLSQCPKCTQKFLWETDAKKFLKRALLSIPARPGLREKILDQLGETGKEGFLSWFTMPPRLAAAFALLLIVALPYLLWQGKIQADIFTDAIAQYQKVTRGIVKIPGAASSFTPTARLLDLSPWGYRILARQTLQVRGQEGRAFVYQGEAKEYLLAQELDGVDLSPPQGARAVRVSNRDFVSDSQEGVNLIAWKEKGFVCIISSTLPKEKLLGLAQQMATSS